MDQPPGLRLAFTGFAANHHAPASAAHSVTQLGRALEPGCTGQVPRASMRARSYHAGPGLAKASVLCISVWMIYVNMLVNQCIAVNLRGCGNVDNQWALTCCGPGPLRCPQTKRGSHSQSVEAAIQLGSGAGLPPFRKDFRPLRVGGHNRSGGGRGRSLPRSTLDSSRLPYRSRSACQAPSFSGRIRLPSYRSCT